MVLKIGARAKRWRLYRGLTLKQMAARSGLHASSLHRMEHGTQDPKHADVEAIAKACGVGVTEFYAFIPPEVHDTERDVPVLQVGE